MVEKIVEKRYGPTSGTVAGWLGVGICAAMTVALAFSNPDLVSLRWMLGLLAAGLLIWSMMLRPVIVLDAKRLVLRNPFSTWLLPLAAIDGVEVRAVTRVRAGDGSYDAVAVGRRVRRMVSGAPRNRITDLTGFAGAGPIEQPSEQSRRRIDASTPEALADVMIEQILGAARDARERSENADPVQRVWALPELTLTAVLVAALMVTLFV